MNRFYVKHILGHRSYYTTEVYLSSFDQEVLDDAADQVWG